MPKKAETDTAPPDGAKKLRKLVKDVRVAMLTTASRDGRLRSRPMLTSQAEDGLWFITRTSSLMADEIRDNQRVNVSYAARKAERYLSIGGVAQLVNDPDKLKELWTGRHKDWFPLGKKDPDLTLLRVIVEQAEAWDAQAGHMVPLAERRKGRGTSARFATAPVTEEVAGAQG